ncbi:MAG TPA: glutamine-hydrolyzing GMP synthase, partial [Thermoprotei archaeon]|nr:glutamine-hydrolyzing GMP synthase [Thermoprotei archaeon]
MDIAILDFGGQYVFNIKRCLLEQGFKATILPFNIPAKKLRNFKGIILSGGPYSVYDRNAPTIDEKILRLGKPILGICYGHQLLAKMLGGKVERGIGEYGFSEIRVLNKDSILFREWSDREICWMSHSDSVVEMPEEVEVLASTDSCKYASFHIDNFYGVQFHPEVSHTPKGYIILRNFAANICGARKTQWNVEGFIEKSMDDIRKYIGDEKAIIAVSGGVDSTTLAVLANKVLGDRLICIHIDTGLMRKHESKRVIKILRKLGLNVIYIDSREDFLHKLVNVIDSDERRKIIGKIFIEKFEEVARKYGVKWLLQGTIAPDVIESSRGSVLKRRGSKHGGLIKIHHNVAGLPENMKLNILEPFKQLFKYQVKVLAKRLGLPKEIVERQPFPGPGLGCRIVGKITFKRLEILREITEIVEKSLNGIGSSQYFAYLVDGIEKPFKSNILDKRLNIYKAFYLKGDFIGVKGDERIIGKAIGIFSPKFRNMKYIDLLRLQSKVTGQYRDICRVIVFLKMFEKYSEEIGIVIRAIDTIDFMTAIPSKINFSLLEEISNNIV